MGQGNPSRQYQTEVRITRHGYSAKIRENPMQPPNGTNRNYEVERRSCHAARPGFRIAELQISPTQTIPWHYHSSSQDTFYVIDGTIRVFTREPEEEVRLTAGQTYAVRPQRPHLVTNTGDTSAVFLVLQAGDNDFVALA
jgi:quercetin dioxygenase-like cupin family protein